MVGPKKSDILRVRKKMKRIPFVEARIVRIAHFASRIPSHITSVIVSCACVAFLLFAISARADTTTWTGVVINSGTLTATQPILVDGTAQLTGSGAVVLSGSSVYIDGDPAAPAPPPSSTSITPSPAPAFIGGTAQGLSGLISFTNQSIVRPPPAIA